MSVAIERLITPATLPVTLEQVKEHARIGYSDEYAGIARILRTVIAEIEDNAQLALLAQTVRLRFDGLRLAEV